MRPVGESLNSEYSNGVVNGGGAEGGGHALVGEAAAVSVVGRQQSQEGGSEAIRGWGGVGVVRTGAGAGGGGEGGGGGGGGERGGVGGVEVRGPLDWCNKICVIVLLYMCPTINVS